MNVELMYAYEIEQALTDREWFEGVFFVVYKDKWTTRETYKEFMSAAQLKEMITDEMMEKVEMMEIDKVYRNFICGNDGNLYLELTENHYILCKNHISNYR